ncbi:hypothetical protein PR048_024105 [Dryococelus australis]|uniref:Transposase n=1 Tax=Dryococelus australis TaxID=614101 RepID=A0ABQ9GVY5_9NEOP|nr:hypothetical protein PR048_024105 [Dryococelus australis]
MNTSQLCSPITCSPVRKGLTSELYSSQWRNHNLWDELDRRVRARQAPPKSIAQLMEWLQEEWRRIHVDVLQTLVESMPDRVAAVIARRAVRLLASHHGEPGSIPVRVTPDFCKWESCKTIDGFSWASAVSPALAFRRCFIITSFTLIGSQDLIVFVPADSRGPPEPTSLRGSPVPADQSSTSWPRQERDISGMANVLPGRSVAARAADRSVTSVSGLACPDV